MTGDEAAVRRLLGREPRGAFEVVVRAADGSPVVIRNAPLLDDGTPMPTLYWLVGAEEVAAVGRLEAGGGVREAQAAVDGVELDRAHRRYAAERAAALPPRHAGPAPTGGVGGSRAGVKCLHAHYAWYLAGGDDPVGRWVSERLGKAAKGKVPPAAATSGRPVAAIDCGTNSIRLLVTAPDGNSIERRMRITRLGEGVDRAGALSREAVARSLRVIGEYRDVMDAHGVGSRMVAATSAVRDAANAEAFLAPVTELVGVRPRVLAGEEEGRLSYRGATAELDPSGRPYVVVDVGGGSTELITDPTTAGAADRVEVCSMDIGCVRATERFLRSDPPTGGEIAEAASYTARLTKAAAEAHPAFRRGATLVGVAGTVSALAVLSLGLPGYDRAKVHHSRLGRAAVRELLAEMAQLDAAARRQMRGMEEARADVIVGGAAVLGAVMDELGYSVLTVSESDILDGMVSALLAPGACEGPGDHPN